MLRTIAENVERELLGVDPSTWPYGWSVSVVVIVLAALVMFVFVALFAGPVSWIERRIAGRIQSRIGPNRVGPQGAIQWLADGLKCFLKEDIIPDLADGPMFRAAPMIVFGGFFSAFVVLPFGANIIAADLNIGLLYVIAVTGLVVIGILAAGWSSNNKWGLFGGIRSAAQLVSYEIPSAFALLTVVLVAGTLSMQELVLMQGGLPWDWHVFRNPFLFAAFFLFLTAAVAEGNRTPFDLPEAESELVAGFHVEYSGMRFLWFMFAEWGNLWVMSAVASVCFLGGWQIPGVSPETIDASAGMTYAMWQLLSFFVLALKVTALVFFVIQLRWTLPRMRVDQMMIICWKYLVPMSMFTVVGVLVLMMLVPEKSVADMVLRGITMLLGVSFALSYFKKVYAAYIADRDLYRKMEGKDLWYPPYRLP